MGLQSAPTEETRMRAGRTPLIVPALGLTLLVAACGAPGSSGETSGQTSASSTASAAAASGAVCAPVAGTQLVVLTDDKHLQQVDNVVPAINGAFAGNNPDIVSVVDTVSAALDTPTLVGLNKAVDVDRKTSSEVAAQFIKDNGLDSPAQVGNNAKVTVGAPNFSEGATLAAIYADALKAAGFDASAQTIGNRETYLPLLEKGDLTLVPEYLGTLATFLNKAQNGASADPVASGNLEATLTALRSLGANAGLVFGNPSMAQDQNAFAVTKAFADAHSITSLSELAATCGGGVTLGGPPECPQRAFCEPGLEKTYGIHVTEFTSLDAGGPLTKAALQQGKVAVGLVFSSDGSLASS
jgi:osmoprotectant transport system substrate-binding protein